jgi:hypothetical protein
MRRRTKVDKVIDLLEEILNDHHFHPALFANIIITSYPPYTQSKLLELIKYIEEYHYQELALDEKTKTGAYRNNNPVQIKSDNSWVHEEFHGEAAHMTAQRVSLF